MPHAQLFLDGIDQPQQDMPGHSGTSCRQMLSQVTYATMPAMLRGLVITMVLPIMASIVFCQHQ